MPNAWIRNMLSVVVVTVDPSVDGVQDTGARGRVQRQAGGGELRIQTFGSTPLRKAPR